MWGVTSEKTWSAKCWALRVVSCQSRNLWNHHLTRGLLNMSSQSRAGIYEIAVWWGGRSANICEITLGGWGVDLPTLGLTNMSFQSRAGICEIAIWWGVGRSAKTRSAKCWALRVGMKYEFHRNLWNCHLMWRARSAKTWSVKCWDLRVVSCQSRNL